jgi:hypothetical protein
MLNYTNHTNIVNDHKAYNYYIIYIIIPSGLVFGLFFYCIKKILYYKITQLNSSVIPLHEEIVVTTAELVVDATDVEIKIY